MYTVSVRDYTTEGRYVDTFVVDCNDLYEMWETLDQLLTENEVVISSTIYKRLGKMEVGEELKKIYRTNIMVRNCYGELISWSYLL
ncbi:hypothetical protein PQC38_gp070 [Aeromonas phage BUCT695]|uniref:hypothetical protein n=1 Tax=Aeromonas phage BUCT695 TaxID=2908630 RepID=UPI0023292908|nr:hypothetical protein PQC38_gp070 [Aeromonas phage BUCT695]UIW10546.1 hypothetical protein [Aeromonas phage BUCT695]